MFCVYWELDNGESGRLNEPVAPDAPQICTVDLVRAGRVRMCHLSRSVKLVTYSLFPFPYSKILY